MHSVAFIFVHSLLLRASGRTKTSTATEGSGRRKHLRAWVENGRRAGLRLPASAEAAHTIGRVLVALIVQGGQLQLHVLPPSKQPVASSPALLLLPRPVTDSPGPRGRAAHSVTSPQHTAQPARGPGGRALSVYSFARV